MELDKNKIKSAFYIIETIGQDGGQLGVIRKGILVSIMPKLNYQDSFTALQYSREMNYLFEVDRYNSNQKRVMVTTNSDMVFENLDDAIKAVAGVQDDIIFDYSVLKELR